MKRRSVVVAGAACGAAAMLGNAFVGRDALNWFRNLRSPRWSMPMPGFVAVATGYYGMVGYLLARALDRGDHRSAGWAVTVLAGNEAWNGLLFGRRSTGAALAGVLAFLVPLAALQRAVWPDPRSRRVLLPYTAYVVLYDLPWSYRLWRLNSRP